MDVSGPSLEVRLADGRVLESRRIGGVLNRLIGIPDDYLSRAEEADRDYVEQEWRALLVSALLGLSRRAIPVVEPPHPYALSGRWRSPVEWSLLAARAGLAVRPWEWRDGLPDPGGPDRSSASVLVIGDRVLADGRLGAEIPAACRRLAALAGRATLQVELGTDEAGTAVFAGAGALPDFRSRGEAAVEALAAVLGR